MLLFVDMYMQAFPFTYPAYIAMLIGVKVDRHPACSHSERVKRALQLYHRTRGGYDMHYCGLSMLSWVAPFAFEML